MTELSYYAAVKLALDNVQKQLQQQRLNVELNTALEDYLKLRIKFLSKSLKLDEKPNDAA